MKISTPLTLLFLTSAAALCLAQETVTPAPKPGTPAPKATAQAAAELAASVPPDAVVIAVGDDKLTRAQFESLVSQLPDQARAAASGPNKRKVAEQLADLKAMAKEARKRKLELQPGAQLMLQLNADQGLATMLFKDIQNNVKVDDATLKVYYDAHKAQFEQAKASHILIRFQGSTVPLRTGEKDLTQDEALAKAQEIRKKLLAGASFSDMAKAESDDTGSGAQGGSLGTFGHGQMVAEFEKAAFSEPIGQISEPIKTKFGYHLLKVEERKTKTFEETKDTLTKELKPKAAQEAVEEVRKQGNITINDAYFGK
jgi:peptidyl-prolyl cis-trans isomerase C